MHTILERELRDRKGVIGVGTVTDPYQPLEERVRSTRRCLELISRSNARASIHTKSDLVLRDMDLLRTMDGIEVGMTITTVDDDLAKVFEPGAPSPSRRFKVLSHMVEEGIDAYLLLGPILPIVVEQDMEGLVRSIADTGINRVIFDPLRVRPRMMDHIRNSHVPETIDMEMFSHLAGSREYFLLIQQKLREILGKHSIRCVNAF
jgi:DNA repair photolyase